MTQLDLLTSGPTASPVRCSAAVPAEAKGRLSQQAQRILDRLQRGPATNKELAGMSLKYTSRLSDIRKAGYTIVCFGLNHKKGTAWYRVEG